MACGTMTSASLAYRLPRHHHCQALVRLMRGVLFLAEQGVSLQGEGEVILGELQDSE